MSPSLVRGAPLTAMTFEPWLLLGVEHEGKPHARVEPILLPGSQNQLFHQFRPTQHAPVNRWNPKGLAFGHPSQDLPPPPNDPGRWKMVTQGPGFLQVRQGWVTELAGSPQANYTRHGCWAWSSGPWRVKEIFLSHKSYREGVCKSMREPAQSMHLRCQRAAEWKRRSLSHTSQRPESHLGQPQPHYVNLLRTTLIGCLPRQSLECLQ